MIPYLKGNEQASASYMNALFSEFDGKLTKLLAGGKSFFLAQESVMNARLCGKAFFFTSGGPVYANKVPGWLSADGNVTRPYNHAPFTNAVAAIDLAKVTWDDANRVATVPAFDISYYAGLPTNLNPASKTPIGTGLLDWSLQAHTLMHQGPKDAQPVPYYILETSAGLGTPPTLVPEKHYKFCVAEIIIEGPTTVALPATFDKYSCFRIHNFNSQSATVKFMESDGVKVVFAVTLTAYACTTIRRDAAAGTTANYRKGYNYFFMFEGGDPRFYWFAPKNFSGSGVNGSAGDGGTCVTNSMVANNLTNPALLLDWVNYFIRDLGPGALPNQSKLDENGWYCGWQQDPAVQADVKEFYKNQFGDPADPATLLGDLIHHRGDILIVRSSKTLTDVVTGKPTVVLDKVKFNGYATIVNDFAAKQLTVVENGGGNLEISNADAANDVYLIPYGTNLLKNGEALPTCISLVGESITIENAIFENPDPTQLGETAPQVIFHPEIETASSTQVQASWDGKSYSISQTLTGNAITQLIWGTNRASAKAMSGIHKVKVSDLLKLDYFGDPAVPGQNSAFVKISNPKLTLTPEGLLLTYTETDSGTVAPSDPNWINLVRGLPTVKSISFRGHGWGYFSTILSAANGSRDTGWLSGRTGRYQFSGAYQYESVGPAGQDFQVNGQPTQTEVAVLGRIKLSGITNMGRFWSTSTGDYLVKFMENAAGDLRTFGALFAASDESSINNGWAPVVSGASAPIAMVLLPEMYNGLARAVNAISKASPLSWKCLRWNVFGYSVGLRPAISGLIGGGGFAYAAGLLFQGTWDPNLNSPPLKSGVGQPGFYYAVNPSGTNNTPLDGISDWAMGDLIGFTLAGKWERLPPRDLIDDVIVWGGGSSFWDSPTAFKYPIPMTCFASFDHGSQYEALCNAVGIPVRDNSDLPDIGPLQGELTGNGILLDRVAVSASNITVDSATPPNTAADLTGEISSELLSTAKLLNGEPTGQHCLGNWSDGLYPVAGADGIIGKYWVVADDFNSTVFGDMKRGDLVTVDAINGDPSGPRTTSLGHVSTPLNRKTGVTPDGLDLNDYANAAGGIRWIKISDVQNLVESFGFQFSFLEVCIPLDLDYYINSFSAVELFQTTRAMPVHASGTSSGVTLPATPYINPAARLRVTSDYRLGIFVKFTVSSAVGAQWKTFTAERIVMNINPGAVYSSILHGVRGSMVYSPDLVVNVGDGTFPAVQRDGQNFGTMFDTVTPSFSEFEIGDVVLAFTASPVADQADGNIEAIVGNTAFNQSGSHRPLLLTRAIQQQSSGSFRGFPTQLLLQGMEWWGRPDSYWTENMFNVNLYIDSFFGLVSSYCPWQYSAPSAPIPVNLPGTNGVAIISVPKNTVYTLLSNLGAPLVSL